MIDIICPIKFEPLLLSLEARVINGKWSIASLPDSARAVLESGGSSIAGAKYHCWGTWFPTIYQVTQDTRCTVSFNTLAKRAKDLTELDSVIIGRAKTKSPASKRKGTGSYSLTYNGEVYPSETALARSFGVDPIKYRSRRQRGRTIEESLK